MLLDGGLRPGAGSDILLAYPTIALSLRYCMPLIFSLRSIETLDVVALSRLPPSFLYLFSLAGLGYYIVFSGAPSILVLN